MAELKDIKEQEGDDSKRKNDVYIFDKRYIKQKVNLKTINGGSIEAIKEHIISGSGQRYSFEYGCKITTKI